MVVIHRFHCIFVRDIIVYPRHSCYSYRVPLIFKYSGFNSIDLLLLPLKTIIVVEPKLRLNWLFYIDWCRIYWLNRRGPYNNCAKSSCGAISYSRWCKPFLYLMLYLLRCLSWWRHQMETFSALLAICAGNSPVPGDFPVQRPVTRSFDVFFDLCLNKRLSKQSWGWWFETLSCSLWRHRNVIIDLWDIWMKF